MNSDFEHPSSSRGANCKVNEIGAWQLARLLYRDKARLIITCEFRLSLAVRALTDLRLEIVS